MANVESWCKACGEVELPSELQDLEDAIHHHQGLYEHITTSYSEVSWDPAGILTYLCSGQSTCIDFKSTRAFFCMLFPQCVSHF